MNGVEAAASLFGPEEPSSDPFAALGAEPAPQTPNNDLFAGEGASNPSHFANTSLHEDDLFSAEDNGAQDASLFYTQPDPTSGYSTSGSHASGSAESTSQQGYFNQQSQWQNYEQVQSVAEVKLATSNA